MRISSLWCLLGAAILLEMDSAAHLPSQDCSSMVEAPQLSLAWSQSACGLTLPGEEPSHYNRATGEWHCDARKPESGAGDLSSAATGWSATHHGQNPPHGRKSGRETLTRDFPNSTGGGVPPPGGDVPPPGGGGSTPGSARGARESSTRTGPRVSAAQAAHFPTSTPRASAQAKLLGMLTLRRRVGTASARRASAEAKCSFSSWNAHAGCQQGQNPPQRRTLGRGAHPGGQTVEAKLMGLAATR